MTPVQEFEQAARYYCAWIEKGKASTTWLYARECLRLTLRLYEAALSLPETPPSEAEYPNGPDPAAGAHVQSQVAANLSRDYYWEIFEPLEPLESDPPEPVVGMLSDDLADIWRGVKTGLMLMQLGTADASLEAIWTWRFSFQTHWGQHAAGAIHALHALCFGAHSDKSRR